MKTIAFFSEKGGVGKSSFTIMYASYLKYRHGLRVAVADFNHRINEYRLKEISVRKKLIQKNPDSGLEPYDTEKAWRVAEVKTSEILELTRNGCQFPYAQWLLDEIDHGRLEGQDIVICDFPGSMSGGEFKQNYACGNLSYVVIPTERDTMTLNSTNKLKKALAEERRCPYSIFMNKAQLTLGSTRNTYVNLCRKLTQTGFPMLPDMVEYSDKMTAIDKVNVFRSTFEFSDFNDKEKFGKSGDLGIENLFADITKILAKEPDIKGTPAVDMSFAQALQKTPGRRSYTGSAYPELEI